MSTSSGWSDPFCWAARASDDYVTARLNQFRNVFLAITILFPVVWIFQTALWMTGVRWLSADGLYYHTVLNPFLSGLAFWVAYITFNVLLYLIVWVTLGNSKWMYPSFFDYCGLTNEAGIALSSGNSGWESFYALRVLFYIYTWYGTSPYLAWYLSAWYWYFFNSDSPFSQGATANTRAARTLPLPEMIPVEKRTDAQKLLFELIQVNGNDISKQQIDQYASRIMSLLRASGKTMPYKMEGDAEMAKLSQLDKDVLFNKAMNKSSVEAEQ